MAILFVVSSPVFSADDCLQRVCKKWLVSPAQIEEWHRAKQSFGPTFAGTEGWRQYMSFIDHELKDLGMVDVRRNKFTYGRWYTSEWPDRSGWSLSVGGQPVDVANYGANSGDTDADGITAEAVHFDGEQLAGLNELPNLAGKVLVLSVRSTPLLRKMPDWLYAPDDFPFLPGETIDRKDNLFQDTVSQLFAANFSGRLPFPEPHYLKLVKGSKAAAAVIIFDMADERVRGLYAFPVPAIYETPTLYLGRRAGQALLTQLSSHSEVTLRLDASVEETEAWQLAATLPGKHYGTDSDEVVMMITHTDGPSISQENGPLGLLSILQYFAQIPRDRRDKSLLLFLDSRHYIPLREAALPNFDIEHVLAPGGPLAPGSGHITASVHLEHLGQKAFREVDGELQATDAAEIGGFYVTGYEDIIELSKAAIVEHKPSNQVLRSTDLPGEHGQSQGIWFGLGHHPRELGIEAIASNMSSMARTGRPSLEPILLIPNYSVVKLR